MTSPGERLAGRYLLVERLADRDRRTVWEAWDERLHRKVALQQLDTDADGAERVRRVAQRLARLNHPHASVLLDVLDDGGRPVLVTSFVDGDSLTDLLRSRGPLPGARAARIGEQVAGALAAAHAAGITHGDVTPDSVRVNRAGEATLVDFGVTRAIEPGAAGPFAAPETDRDAQAADVYSLGATLYAAVEGGPPGPDAHPRSSDALAPALARMLRRDPAERPVMAEVVTSLDRLRDDTVADLPTTQLPVAPLIPLSPPGPPSPVRLDPEDDEPWTDSTALPGDRRSGGRGWLIALVVLVVLVIATGAGLALLNSGSGSGRSTTGIQTLPTQPPAPSTRASTPSAAPRTSAAATTRRPTPTAEVSGIPRASATASSTVPTKAETVATITRYYQLLPQDTGAAFALLTPQFQQGKAGGRAAYDRFWAQFRDVSASALRPKGSGVITATITYVHRDGKRTRSRQRYQLVKEHGVVLIATSRVLH